MPRDKREVPPRMGGYRNNTDHILDRLMNWQYLLPPIKLFYILP